MMEDFEENPAKRMRLSADESLQEKEEILKSYEKQQDYINELENKMEDKTEDKMKSQLSEANRRENVLLMRLASKEQELQDLVAQMTHIKKHEMETSSRNLKSALLDPSVNLLFSKMKQELKDSKDKLEQAQSELSAWKFTPDSQTGKKLMSRCRTLIAENKELGQQISQGKVAQLEAELALQKKYSEELKQSQDEVNEFVIQLDEEVEGMQSTIQMLQQELIDTKKELQDYKSQSRQIYTQRSVSECSIDEDDLERRDVQHDRRSVSSYRKEEDDEYVNSLEGNEEYLDSKFDQSNESSYHKEEFRTKSSNNDDEDVISHDSDFSNKNSPTYEDNQNYFSEGTANSDYEVEEVSNKVSPRVTIKSTEHGSDFDDDEISTDNKNMEEHEQQPEQNNTGNSEHCETDNYETDKNGGSPQHQQTNGQDDLMDYKHKIHRHNSVGNDSMTADINGVSSPSKDDILTSKHTECFELPSDVAQST